MASDGWLVRLQDIALGYSGRVALSVSGFQVRGGELVAVVGENGSGKSTLLHGLARVIQPLSGTVEWSDESGGRDKIAFVPQNYVPVDPLPMTLEEYVRLGFVGTKTPGASRRGLITEALTSMGIASLARKQVDSLSGGQQRRAMLARALVRKPGVLLVDEPESGLDSDTRAFVVSYFDEFCKDGGCVVAATHDHAWANKHADRLYQLIAGRVVDGGSQ